MEEEEEELLEINQKPAEGERGHDGTQELLDADDADDDDDDDDDEVEDDDDEDEDAWSGGDDGSLADDEDEDDDDEGEYDVMIKDEPSAFPLVTIINTTEQKHTELCDVTGDVRADDVRSNDVSINCGKTAANLQLSPKNRCVCCGELLSSLLSLVAGALVSPLLVWAGYELLPFDAPVISSTPYRLVYTLRCALFASFPLVLGVLVYGVSHLRFSSVTPLFSMNRVNQNVLVHMNFVRDSLRLFFVFFILLSVMSTYIHQEALKLVPLLIIVFTFGRLVYWPLLCFSSSVRTLGFSLSFLPILLLMGLNLYYICSSTGDRAVFSVAPPPTTAPPPKYRWWG